MTQKRMVKTTIQSSERTNKKPNQNKMKPKIRTLLERAIDEGISYGYHRAHKYTDFPDEDLLAERINYGIWLELDAIFSFDEEVEE